MKSSLLQNAPMRFFYRVAQEEQRLEAPPHERPSTPGLGACFPPNDGLINAENDSNSDNLIKQSESSRSQIKPSINNSKTFLRENLKTLDKKVCSSVDQTQTTLIKKDETNKTMPLSTTVSIAETSPMLTVTNTAMTTAKATTETSLSTEICNDSNKNIKSPIKILKNPDGKYEVQKSPPVQTATITDTKSTNPEFSVVSIGNGQNSNGVKITLKQCSPTNNNVKKPKVISNVLLRCSQAEKDLSSTLLIQKLHEDQSKLPISQDKQEKQRRKVTFVDQSPYDKNSSNSIIPKTALKKPAELQDKKQFLQGFELTAREPVLENTKSSVRDINIVSEIISSQKNNVKIEESCKKNIKTNNEKKEKSENNLNANSSSISSTIVKRFVGTAVNDTQICTNKGSNDVNGYKSNPRAGSSVNMNSNNSTKMDIYAFSNDPPIVPAGAVKRKCPPGLKIVEVKRKKQYTVQNQGNKKQNVSAQSSVKLPHNSLTEHGFPTNKKNNIITDHGVANRVPNMNPRVLITPMLSKDTKNLLDGCGLSIPASLSITLTAPKSSVTPGSSVESNDSNDSRKTTLGKVSPSITLNDRSVDTRVLKALKTGQIKMPTPSKCKQTKQTDRDTNQLRITPAGKRAAKREHESREILDLSGGKKMDMHPLRIPQPVTKLKTKAVNRANSSATSDQGQVVTLMSGHRYYRAAPGSLTPAVHRVNDFSLPTPSRTPVYAPTGLSLSGGRTNSNFSSVFPSLQSLYALSQAPNLQQFQMDGRLRLPRTENIVSTIGNSDTANSNSNCMPGKSHLAAQCAPIKPARSSIAPLAVPINKHLSLDKAASTSMNKIVSNSTSNPSVCRNSENLVATDNVSCLTTKTRFSLIFENKNKFLSHCDTDNTSKDKIIVENIQQSNAELRNESVDIDNSTIQQQCQPQPQETASPRVSSTASPSPPPGDGSINSRNEESNTSHNGSNINVSKEEVNTVKNITSSPPKNNNGPEVTSSKSPASPDSSSITVERVTNKNCSTSIDQETPISDTVKLSNLAGNANDNVVNELTISEDKNEITKQTDAKQLTSEIVQKRLLAVFPSNEWANNPIAAEHLGNFLKSLNASIKNEEHIEESKSEKADRTVINNDSTKIDSETSLKLKDSVESS